MEPKNEKPKSVIIADFGSDMGELTKHDVSEIFVDLHASISPLDPLSLKMASSSNNAAN